MEHRTTAAERTLRKTAKTNQRLKKAYEEKNKLSHIARQQLFHISLKRRKEYRPETNERWLQIVTAAKANRKRQNEKLSESLGRISQYFPTIQKQQNIRSKQAGEYAPPNTVQRKITQLFPDKVHVGNRTNQTARRNLEGTTEGRTKHRKYKISRLTEFFKYKPG